MESRPMHCIYLDNNTTTPLLPAALDAMRPYLTEIHGNPASAHQLGRKARQALETAREQVAALLDETDVRLLSIALGQARIAVHARQAMRRIRDRN